ncbi:MAG: lysophospholipid acyltransferase family protein [Candidatus Eisenbacteria bacterium]
MAFTLLVLRPLLTLFIGLRVYGRENLPAKDPFILVANHSSHLDTAALLGLFRVSRLRWIRPCAAADYFERTRWRAVLSRTFFNVLPVRRTGFHAQDNPVQQMRAALERGESLVLFPEGSRGPGPGMAPFKSGVAHLAEQLPHVPIVPAYLTNMGRALPKGEFIPVPFFCEVRIGPPVRLSGSRAENLESIRAALESLRDHD